MTGDRQSILQRLDAAGRFVENLFLVGLLATMMLLSVAQIIAREVFDTGFFWAGELIRILVLWLAMVGAVAACRENRHIRVDAISHLLSARTVAVARVLVDVFAAVVCAVIAWQSWRYIQVEIEYEDTVLISTPAWVAHIVVPVAFALLSYRFLVGVGSSLVQIREGGEAIES
jgi:TRAP-type C4-dicarboxylate transport system permease small subunit